MNQPKTKRTERSISQKKDMTRQIFEQKKDACD
jgi:hypothetical protein